MWGAMQESAIDEDDAESVTSTSPSNYDRGGRGYRRSCSQELLLPRQSRGRLLERSGRSRPRGYGAVDRNCSPAGSSNSSASFPADATSHREPISSSEPTPYEGPVKWTRRQWQILIVLMAATCSSSFAVCLFPPFFPRLAEEKGQSATIYGFVIGTNCLTSFIVTPVIGKNLPKVGVKYAFSWGMLIGGICCSLSGFLEFFPPDWRFVATAVFLRVVHATGNAVVITSSFTYSAVEFHDCVGTMFSFTRTAMNLAQLLGPLVGGAIYQAGGFYLPFVSMGALQAGMGIISICILPDLMSVSETSNGKKSDLSKKITILNILRIPTIWFSFVTFIFATMCNGFLSINLEPRILRRFELKPVFVGLLFGLKDGANSIASPILGYFCDKNGKASVKPYMILSACLVATSFILMGAGRLLGLEIERGIPLLVFALCLNGVGIGGEQVAGVVDALHEATGAGYPDDPSMHGLIAGLWSSLSGAGRFISRVGSGILVDVIGFNMTAAIATGLQLLIAALTFVYVIFWECGLKQNASVHWQDVNVIEEDGEGQNNNVVVFTESVSPCESLMAKTVSVDVPRRSRCRSVRVANSCPPAAGLSESERRRIESQTTRNALAYSLLPNLH